MPSEPLLGAPAPEVVFLLLLLFVSFPSFDFPGWTKHNFKTDENPTLTWARMPCGVYPLESIRKRRWRFVRYVAYGGSLSSRLFRVLGGFHEPSSEAEPAACTLHKKFVPSWSSARARPRDQAGAHSPILALRPFRLVDVVVDVAYDHAPCIPAQSPVKPEFWLGSALPNRQGTKSRQGDVQWPAWRWDYSLPWLLER
ncbi:hypothetical protein B0H14DRAFT_3889202 [Mycena olivaceomarginata]|nr:hypothetical protein B0H14DRAFT_3889202 [Mycena olivaceomarginata]